MLSEKEKIAHLYRRATFGLPVWNALPSNMNDALQNLFSNSIKYDSLSIPGDEKIKAGTVLQMEPAKREEFLMDLAANVKMLNLRWIELMAKTQSQLREKMALFWHNHLALRGRGVKQVENYADTIRGFALENFGTMLMEIAKEPAMLRFLNAAQNRKESPNENFARELLELFTMGRGHYREQDIKEAARAFTGWSVDVNEEFKFRPKWHDSGSKTFLGKTGNWQGEDIIKMALEQKQTALYISRKLWRFLVSPIDNEEHIKAIADLFYSSNYEIKPVLKFIFESDWFYDPKVSSPIIKSPVELLVGLTRQFGIQYQDLDQLLSFQRLMGQALFFPPNVSGWAGGRAWIDNTTLILRLKLPEILFQNSSIETEGNINLNKEDAFKKEPDGQANLRQIDCSINWKMIANQLNNQSKKEIIENFNIRFFHPDSMLSIEKLMIEHGDDFKTENGIKKLSLAFTKSLSYQLM